MRWSLLLVLSYLLGLGACASPGPAGNPWVQDTLYFGLSRPGGVVSQGEWQVFVDTQVTPRFPHGLTHWKAQGQWKEGSGPLAKEDSRVLQIIHPAVADAETKIQAIRQAYCREFRQTSVLRVKNIVQADF